MLEAVFKERHVEHTEDVSLQDVRYWTHDAGQRGSKFQQFQFKSFKLQLFFNEMSKFTVGVTQEPVK